MSRDAASYTQLHEEKTNFATVVGRNTENWRPARRSFDKCALLIEVFTSQ
jgi:hypothetical protein